MNLEPVNKLLSQKCLKMLLILHGRSVIKILSLKTDQQVK